VDEIIFGVNRLRNADARDAVLGALWDLRDSAYDHPQLWHALTAETLLQALAQILDDAAVADSDWPVANRLLARAFEMVLALESPAIP
jgi:hypothetical protein